MFVSSVVKFNYLFSVAKQFWWLCGCICNVRFKPLTEKNAVGSHQLCNQDSAAFQVTSLNFWESLVASSSDGDKISSVSGKSNTSMLFSPPATVVPASSSSVAYSPVCFRRKCKITRGDNYLHEYLKQSTKYKSK